MISLIESFLSEEATPFVRKLIDEAVRNRSKEVQKRFEFNRFEITLDFEKNVALIEDVLQPGPKGEEELPLGRFIKLLKNE